MRSVNIEPAHKSKFTDRSSSKKLDAVLTKLGRFFLKRSWNGTDRNGTVFERLNGFWPERFNGTERSWKNRPTVRRSSTVPDRSSTVPDR